MIRIAVIGANGQAGRHIVAEALASGRILPALTPW